jgi:hypothetical protein
MNTGVGLRSPLVFFLCDLVFDRPAIAMLLSFRPDYIYPVPQNAPCVSAGMNVQNSPRGQCPKATDVSPWYGVYLRPGSLSKGRW